MREAAIGIDLGTTFSAVAAIGPSGRPEIVPNAEGERITASAVYFQETGPIVVGQLAADAAGAYPDRVVRWVKRHMGDNDWSISVDEKAYSAVDLSAIILKKLKEDTSKMLGTVKRAVITVPAYFDEVRRKATMDAAELAGLEVLRIINEPTAAALAYAAGGHVTGKVLIYDFGGGTFDVSVAEIISQQEVNIIASEGDHQLGGFDLDNALAQYLSGEFEAKHGVPLMSDEAPGTRHNTLKEAEKAKRTLSTMQDATGVMLQWGGHAMSPSVSRDQFEKMISEHITRTEMLVEDALDQAGIKPNQLDAVILAGGSTRIPAVREMLKKKVGLEPITSINPDEAVALGAAIQAGIIMQERGLLGIDTPAAQLLTATRLRDVTNHSYGTISIGDAYGGDRLRNTIIISKNSPIPCSQTKSFFTHSHGQNEVKCTITQGEDEDPEFIQSICEGMLNLPAGRPPGCEIRVTYSYDANQRMSCRFLDVESGTEKTFDLDVAGKEQGVANAAALDEKGFDDLDIM